ncbi:cyclic nucleotide-binding protein [Legionella busanensis]|uniref:Cyclic nucleotide-binding protein n=1 Tax=Legionella busanensis TaxID=190655 RepID=A0A378JLZ1_9GAMM|nr:Crp/Fnr family transcriptional regulator [Legionella busanensis]STX51100.1 cyclic nucleotide-binding protein [Legionella busanensis]
MNAPEKEMDALKILQVSPLFSKLRKAILWRIASLAQKETFAEGEYLIRQGEQGDKCFIISKGLVEIFYESNNKRIPIAKVAQGEILGELAIIDSLPRSASAVALLPTEALIITQWDFKAQLQAYPEIALELLPLLAQRLRQTQNQLIKDKNE